MTIKEVVEKWSKESYDKQGYVIGGSDITVLIKSLEEFARKHSWLFEDEENDESYYVVCLERLIGTKEVDKK